MDSNTHVLAFVKQVIKLTLGILTKSNARRIREIERLLCLVQIDKVTDTHVSHGFNNTVRVVFRNCNTVQVHLLRSTNKKDMEGK